MSSLLEDCASGLLETAPQIVKTIRKQMRSNRTSDLSVPQFRSLAFVHKNADASLSDLADHLGLTLASASKLADGLVRQGYMTRQESSFDRRKLVLSLTAQGQTILDSALANTQTYLARILHQLSEEELNVVYRALLILQPLFSGEIRLEESKV